MKTSKSKKGSRRERENRSPQPSEPQGDESPDESQKLYELDETFAFNHGGDDPLGGGDVIFDTLDAASAHPPLLGHRDGIRDMAFDSKSNTLFTASWDETVLAWDMLTSQQSGLLPHGAWVNAVVTSRADDTTLKVITGAEDGNLTLWKPVDSTTGRDFLVFEQYRLFHGAITCLCAHESSTVFAASLEHVDAFSLSSGSVVRRYRLASDVNALLALDEQLFCACDDGKVVCLDIVGGFALRQLSGHTGAVRRVVAAQAFNMMYSAGDDGCIKVWMLSTGQCTKTWHHHKQPITSLAVHVGERDRFLYSGSMDGVVRCTRLATGTSLVCRHCTANCILACDVVDPTVVAERKAAKEKALTPAAIAAANLRLGHTSNSTSRRPSLRDVLADEADGGGRLVCGDYRGRLYRFPTSVTESAVTSQDVQKHVRS